MYQHINHATMVTILEEARIPFLREPFGPVIEEIGLLIHEVNILYKGQLRLIDSPLQVTMWSKRVRAVDFTIGYEVRSVRQTAGLQAVGHRRDAAGDRPHQGATAGTAFARAARVSPALPSMTEPDRGIWLDDATHREDLATFTERALRLDDTAVIRLRERAGGLVVAWVATGFDVLASRVVGGRIKPADLSAAADALSAGLMAMDRSGYVDPGFAMDSAWRGALPPETGFLHLDDVPGARGARPCPARRRAGEGTLERAWAARVTAGSGSGCGQLGGHQRRHPNALRIRFDRNGFPAAVGRCRAVGPRHCRRGRDRAGARAARLAAHRRALWFGVPPSRRPGLGAALGVPSRACACLHGRHGVVVSLRACGDVQLWRGRVRPQQELHQPGGGVRRQLAVDQLAAGQQHLTLGQDHRAGARIQRAHHSAAHPERQAVRR